MSIDRPSVKARSREIIRTAQPKVLVASLIVLLLFAVFAVLSNQLTGISAEDAARYMRYLEDGNADAALNILVSRSPSPGAQLVDLAISCVQIIVGLGFMIFLLNTLRGTGAVYANLLDGFSYWWKVLVLNFVIGILVALWSLLLVVPGIVAAYRYSMADYLLITHPEYGIMDCIRESKRLTKGYKGQLFVLDLSFIGWILLGIVPIVGWLLMVWVTPYRQLSNCSTLNGSQVRTRKRSSSTTDKEKRSCAALKNKAQLL